MDNNKLQITTLDDIRVLRKQALLDVQQQKKALGTTARKLIAPLAPTVNKGNSIMKAFNTGMALFDGFILGIKLIRKFHRGIRKEKTAIHSMKCSAIVITKQWFSKRKLRIASPFLQE